MSGPGTKRTCKHRPSTTIDPVTAAAAPLMNVRFEENNGHDAGVMRCLLMTQNGHGGDATVPGGVTGYPVRLLESGSSNVSCRA